MKSWRDRNWLEAKDSKHPSLGRVCLVVGMFILCFNGLITTIDHTIFYAMSLIFLLPASIWTRGLGQLVAIAGQTVAIFFTVVEWRTHSG